MTKRLDSGYEPETIMKRPNSPDETNNWSNVGGQEIEEETAGDVSRELFGGERMLKARLIVLLCLHLVCSSAIKLMMRLSSLYKYNIHISHSVFARIFLRYNCLFLICSQFLLWNSPITIQAFYALENSYIDYGVLHFPIWLLPILTQEETLFPLAKALQKVVICSH
jgi:hypothetical protein